MSTALPDEGRCQIQGLAQDKPGHVLRDYDSRLPMWGLQPQRVDNNSYKVFSAPNEFSPSHTGHSKPAQRCQAIHHIYMGGSTGLILNLKAILLHRPSQRFGNPASRTKPALVDVLGPTFWFFPPLSTFVL